MNHTGRSPESVPGRGSRPPLDLPRVVNAAFVAREVGDAPMSKAARELHARVRRRHGESLHAEMLRAIVPVASLSDQEARCLWRHIVEHRAHMRAELGREVPLAVAALDYLLANHAMARPVLVEEEALRELVVGSTRDPLTGVLNRGAFQGTLEREFARAHRYGHPVSLVMLDVDRFKELNDTSGHLAGDAVLRRLGGLLRDAMRSVDWCARYGGDEFVVIAGDTDEAGAGRLATRILEEARRDAIRLSAGVAEVGAADTDASVVIQAADRALYTSKHRGGNCVTRASQFCIQ